MAQQQITVECPVNEQSFRVAQVAGMFDLDLKAKASASFDVDVPLAGELVDGQPWKIGLIVGPSGSGKSTVARAAYGDAFYTPQPWPRDAAIVDGFGDVDMREITQWLSAVGFSSPPSWVKPYAVLSNGEQFRCDLARSLLTGGPLVAYDEFTSVVDRTVAKVGSAAIAKAIRKGKIDRQFVAVTCHYDIAEWLTPDWILDMASGRLARGSLQRPQIKLEVAPIDRSAWLLFRRHHYLNTNLSITADCFAAFWNNEPVAFSAWTHRMTRQRRRGDMREHRTVVLPDFQGVGIGNHVSELCASIYRGIGGRAFSTTSHPSMIGYRSASPLWKRHRHGMAAPLGKTAKIGMRNSASCGRITAGFEYVGPPMPREQASAFLTSRPEVFAERDSVKQILELVQLYSAPSAPLLVRATGLSDAGVRRILAELVERGEIVQIPGQTRAIPTTFSLPAKEFQEAKP